MAIPIGSIQGLSTTGINPAMAPVKPIDINSPQDGLFQKIFEQSVNTVQAQQTAAQQSVDRFLSGEGEEVHQVALAAQKAELSFEMFLQVRNKVVSAYQEIMRMQI
jgi:flagellar hook-basal body complex protein FliE